MHFCFEDWLCKSSTSANPYPSYEMADIFAYEQKKISSMCYCCITGTAETVCTEFCRASYISRRSVNKFLVQGQCCSLDALVKSKRRQMSCAGVMAGKIYEPERLTAWISDCLGLKGWQFKTKQNKQIKTCRSEHGTMWNTVKSFVHDSDFREEFCFCINCGQQWHNSSCFFLSCITLLVPSGRFKW